MIDLPEITWKSKSSNLRALMETVKITRYKMRFDFKLLDEALPALCDLQSLSTFGWRAHSWLTSEVILWKNSYRILKCCIPSW